MLVWTSVTALADAHINALTISEASGQRFLITHGDYDMQELADILRSSKLGDEVKERIPIGEPGKRLTGMHFTVDCQKARGILNLEEPLLENTVIELVEQLLEMEMVGQSRDY